MSIVIVDPQLLETQSESELCLMLDKSYLCCKQITVDSFCNKNQHVWWKTAKSPKQAQATLNESLAKAQARHKTWIQNRKFNTP